MAAPFAWSASCCFIALRSDTPCQPIALHAETDKGARRARFSGDCPAHSRRSLTGRLTADRFRRVALSAALATERSNDQRQCRTHRPRLEPMRWQLPSRRLWTTTCAPRTWHAGAVGTEGPAQDVRDVLRRARPGSSVEILGHSVGGITYRHYAHRAPLAFRAIMTLPQPTAFSALLNGCDGECPCCHRRFADAA